MALYDSVLITGGAGMLAAAFKAELTQRGIHFVAPPRSELDITQLPSLKDYFKKLKPTLILNCAAYTKVDLAEKEAAAADAINGHAVGALAMVCRESGAALVHYSTDYVFDGTLRRPLRPDDPVGPAGAYGKSKLLGEQLLQETPPPRWLVLRTSWLYGPGGPCFPATMLNAGRAGKPLKVVCDQIGSPTFTPDLAATTLDLLDAGANGIGHVANAGQTNWCEFAQATLDEFGVPGKVAGISSAEWQVIRPDSAPRPAYSLFDLSPIKSLLGRPMPDWTDGLRRYHLATASR